MRVSIVERRPLLFREPFGEGADRHVHVRAASSIVRFGDAWLIAQDDSNFAAIWRPDGIDALRLFPNVAGDTFSPARSNKRNKPDLECGFTIALEGRSHAVFLGSGSTGERHRAAIVDPSLNVRIVDVRILHSRICESLGLDPGQLNIEGATEAADGVVFAQRGNDGETGVNALVHFTHDDVANLLTRGKAPERPVAWPVALGRLDGARLGFTSLDALDDGTLLFAAAAEASANTYDDGACTGSILGFVRGANVIDSARIGTGTDKIEGIAISKEFPGGFEAWAVCDADDPERPADALLLDVRF